MVQTSQKPFKNTCAVSSISFLIAHFRYHIIAPKPGDLNAILDAAKAADTIVFAYSLEHGVDVYGEYIFSTLFGHGKLTEKIGIVHLCALTREKIIH